MSLFRKIYFSLLLSLLSLGLTAQFLVPVMDYTNVSCYNGSDGTGEVISVIGGVPPYTYQWLNNDLTPIADSTNSTISGLPAGTYFVQVWDSDTPQSMGQGVITLQNGPNMAVLVFSTDVKCNGENNGSIFINAVGGNAPLTYSIDGGSSYQENPLFENLSPGNYTIIVQDSKGCTKIYDFNPVVISEPAPLTVSLFSKTDINCYGADNGEILVTTSGGSTPYSFEWTKDVSYFADTEDIFPLPPGNYSLTVEDGNACKDSLGPINISEALQIIINNVSATPESCNDYADGTVTVTASGGTDPLKYTLTPGSGGPDIINNDGIFNNLKGDTYSLSVTDANNCGPVVWGAGIFVDNPPVVEVDDWDTTNITCNGADNGIITVIGTGGTPPYKYMLNPDMIPSANGIFNGISPGSGYFVEVSDDNDCPADSTPILDFTEPAPIVITVDSTFDVTCNGDGDGIIYVSATGGSGSYVFTLTPPVGPSVINSTGTFTGLIGGSYSISVTDSKGCDPDLVNGIIIVDPDPVSIDNIDISPILCFGDNNGIIDVTAAGGTGLLHYTLNPGGLSNNDGNFTLLGPDTYDVSVTDDNGCPAATAANLEVIEPSEIRIDSVSSTPIQCFGSNDGSITVYAAGGTPPLEYTLNHGGGNNGTGFFDGLTPKTNYRVTVSDTNGCPTVSTTPVDMIEPAIITLTGVDTNNVSCNGEGDGSLQVAAAGGTPPYSYTLNPGSVAQDSGTFINLTGGSYSVIVTDSRTCPPDSASDLVIIDPDPITISDMDTTDVSCNGAGDGTVIVTASGGTGTLYYTLTPETGPAINNTDGNFTGLPGEIYSLSITDDNSCTPDTATNLVVFEPPAISIDLEESTEISCFGADDASIRITASGGVGTLTYTLRDPAVVAVNETGLFEGLGTGPYTVGVNDDNGCGPEYSNAFSFVEPTPLAVTVDATSSKVLACFGDSTGSLDITVTGGTTPYNFNWTGPDGYTNNVEDISGLKAGDYNLVLTDSNSCVLDSIPLDSITGPPRLTMSTNKNDITCFGTGDGSVIITAGGGTPPYQFKRAGLPYQVSDTFSSLNPGPYTFFTRDNNGCETSHQDTILQPQELIISKESVDNDGQLCNGDSNGIITITAVGGTGPLEYSIDTGKTYFPNNVFTNLPGGSYHIYVRDANLCTVPGTKPLIINPPLLYIRTYTQPDTSTCFASPEGSVFIEGGGGSFPMKYVLNESDTSTTGFFENLNEGPHDLQVLDAKGCSRDTTVLLYAPPPIVDSIRFTHVTTCYEDSSGAIAIIATGGTGLTKAYTLQGNTTFSSDTVFYNKLPGGTYDITVSDSLGCEIYPVAIINAPDSISTDSIKVFPVTCNGLTDGVIRVFGSGGTPPYSYILNPGADTNTTGIFSSLTAGNYTVTVKDAVGCKPHITPPLTVIEPPTLLFDSSATTAISCGGFNDGAITIFVSGGLPPYSYSVDSGVSFGPDMVVTGLGPGTHIILVRDSAGCSVPGDTIELLDPPGLSLDPSSVVDVALCAGDSSGSISVSATGGTGSLEYSLDSTSWQPTGDFNNLPAGIYTAVVRDSKSCILAFPADTVLEPPPILAVITTATAMIPAPGSISISATGGTPPLEYSIDSGASFSSQTLYDVPSEIYYVVIRDANGCTYRESVYVPATPPLLVDVSFIGIDCYPNNNGAINLAHQNGIGIVKYSIDGGINFQLTGIFEDLAGGDYHIEVTDSQRVFRDTVSITDPPPFDIISSIKDATCSRNSYDGAISLMISGATPPYTYLWSNGATTKDIANLEGKEYSLTVTDANNCESINNFTVPAFDTLIADAGSDTTVCYGTEAVLNGSGGDQFSWSPAGGLSQDDIPNPSTTVTDSAVYVLFTRNQASGCYDSDTVLLTVHPDRGISAGQDTTVAPGQTITLTASGGPFSNYLWQPSEGLENPNSQSTNATVQTETTYTVTGTTEFGCEESDSMYISIATGLGIYSGFTPNNDGTNDYWDIDDIIFYPNATVKVFDRWGKVVFSSVGYADNQRWDGKYKGKDLPTGTYYYIIDLKDGSEPYKGPVTIVR